MGREDGVLFREPWPSPDEPCQTYGGLTTEKLVPILLHILQKQDERIGKLEIQDHIFALLQEQGERIRKLEAQAILREQRSVPGLAKRAVRKLKRTASGLRRWLSRGKP